MALFVTLLLLLKKPDFDEDAWAGARAEGYLQTLDGIYSMGKVTAKAAVNPNEMLTFGGEDGTPPEWPCKECEELKGQTHPVSWWLSTGLIPGVPGNDRFTCLGYNCRHILIDSQGNEVTLA